MEAIEDLPIVREEPAPPIEVTEHQIGPILSDAEYKTLNFCYATPDMGRNEIQPNVVYWDWAEYDHPYQVEVGEDKLEWRIEKRKRKRIKFLLLPSVISSAAWLKATVAARECHMNKGTRGADGQKYGRKLTLGWIKLRYPGYDNFRTAPTLEQPELLAAFYPLIREMDSLVQWAVPEYHDFAFRCAMTAVRREDQRDDLSRITKERGLNIVKALDPWDMTYTIRGTVFSTVEFNHNILFKAHEDGSNVDGTCVCITTLDCYAGGRLVFPRYGYSAELGPRDLLLCDNNKELHGNLGPIVGDRFSVVAFLHESVCGRAAGE